LPFEFFEPGFFEPGVFEEDIMKRIIPIFAIIALIAVTALAQGMRFTLKSADIASRSTIALEQVFNGLGCTGKNISPSLEWSGVPAAAKSLALIVHDPDAATGVGGFTHWIVYNIPVKANKLERGAGSSDGKLLPSGAVQHATSFGTSGWGGPCPPAGDKPHRYVFTLYAVGVEKLELPANASQAFVGFNINGNAVGKASFMAFYGR
jgi:Raf kinase inhibitor-like YbhB/YbcL family protein